MPAGCASSAPSAREQGIPLIFDEVYTGFRLAPGGAQAYFGVARRHGRLRKDRRGRHAHRGRVRQASAHAPVRSRAPDADRVRDRHVLRPPGGDGGDERVPALGQPCLRRRDEYEAMDRRCAAWAVGHQPRARRRRAAAPGGAPRHGVDGPLHGARTVQLAAPVLPARRRVDAELGRHGPLPEQHGLLRGGLRRVADEGPAMPPAG